MTSRGTGMPALRQLRSPWTWVIVVEPSSKSLPSLALAVTLMRDGNYSREEIAELAGIELHTVDYLFADLRRSGERDGVCFHLRIR